jgi:hypothetical protein
MRLPRFLKLGALSRMPAGMTADPSANFALFALLVQANNYCGHLENITSAGTNSTLTAAQVRRRVLRFTTGASGGFTITLPSTSAIIDALNTGNCLITDGTYGQPFSILNDGVGQTGTLTAGDASTTITGTATALTNTRRDFFLMVTSPTTITIYNIGSAAI